MVRLTFLFVKCPRHTEGLESQRQPRVGICIYAGAVVEICTTPPTDPDGAETFWIVFLSA
jgi:hypothetical protein